jgi:hypothetical protein
MARIFAAVVRQRGGTRAMQPSQYPGKGAKENEHHERHEMHETQEKDSVAQENIGRPT